jgi:hypothetical protein
VTMGIGSNYPGIGPERGVAFIFHMALVSQANTKVLQSNPTIAEGDFKVSIDDGAFNNLATTPTVSPASGKAVKVSLSAAEMLGDNIKVLASDASGSEWCDRMISIQTSPGAAQAVMRFQVDSANFAPTTTEFETSDITEATANHLLGRVIVFRSGALAQQATYIEGYSLQSGKGHFTVTTLE